MSDAVETAATSPQQAQLPVQTSSMPPLDDGVAEQKTGDSIQPAPAAAPAASVASSSSALDPFANDTREQPVVTGSIRVLPTTSRALLSSDQLLTSPSSFLRELLENALDSGATTVSIHVQLDRDGCGVISEMEVRDNGVGIRREESELIARAHCTSKIQSFEDIVAAATESGSGGGGGGISSFGFRGEALHCIAGSVASLVVQSKRADAAVAWRTTWSNGKRGATDSVAQAGPGTSVRVKGLFFNRPVRVQMARKEAKAEQAKVQELLRCYAFVHPQVRILCNEPSFHKAAAQNAIPPTVSGLPLFREAIPLLLGTSSGLNQMLEIEANTTEGFQIEGFVTRHDVSAENKELLRAKSDRIFLYITRTRSISLPWLTKAIVSEWRTRATNQLQRRRHRANGVPTFITSGVIDPAVTSLLSGKFPLCVLKVTVPSPASSLDLNRSPEKRDILLGDLTRAREHLSGCVAEGMRRAFAQVEQREEREWRESNPVIAAGVPPPLQARAAAATIVSTPESDVAMEDSQLNAAVAAASTIASTPSQPAVIDLMQDDDIPLTHPPVLAASQSSVSSTSSSMPPLSGAGGRSPATTSPAVDFSHFARPMTQPQLFARQPNELPPAAGRQHAAAAAAAVSSPSQLLPSPRSSTAAPSTPPAKRARLSAGSSSPSSAAPQSASSMRQSQLSLVDAVNSSISYAERVIPVDEAMIQQMKEGFENLRGEEEEEEEIARSTPPLVKPQYIGSLPDRPEICLLRVADDPFDAFGDPLPSPSLPTLTSLSLLRGDESLLFQQLLGVYDVPRQPLDSAIPIDESFPMLTAVERSKLSHSVLSAERLHLEQNIPAGRATFQQCMRLCGFVIKMGGQATAGEAGDTAAAPLHLVEVPSDSMIGIHDFLATVRKVWEDEEYLRCETVPVKGTTPGELPSCEWRVDGVRRLIREQATAAAKVRIDQMIAATRETGVEAQAGKMIDRLQALVKSKFASAAGESSSEQSGWTRLACPHDRPIAHRLTNHATKKQEA